MKIRGCRSLFHRERFQETSEKMGLKENAFWSNLWNRNNKNTITSCFSRKWSIFVIFRSFLKLLEKLVASNYLMKVNLSI